MQYTTIHYNQFQMKASIMYVEYIDENGLVIDIFREIYVPELEIAINYYNSNTNIIDLNVSQANQRYKTYAEPFSLDQEVEDRISEIYYAHKIMIAKTNGSDSLLALLH